MPLPSKPPLRLSGSVDRESSSLSPLSPLLFLPNIGCDDGGFCAAAAAADPGRAASEFRRAAAVCEAWVTSSVPLNVSQENALRGVALPRDSAGVGVVRATEALAGRLTRSAVAGRLPASLSVSSPGLDRALKINED